MNKGLFAAVSELPFYEDLEKKLQTGNTVHVSGCADGQKANMCAALGEGRPLLYICENELKARDIFDDLRLYRREVYLYPARDMLFFQADSAKGELTRQRLTVIRKLIQQENISVVTHIGGCMDKLLPFGVFRDSLINIRSGDELDLTALSEKLVYLGYERCGKAEKGGQFSVRGGIIDIYDCTVEVPYRVELWGDEVDSIRSFDPQTQRSIENLQEISIFPATEDIGAEEKDFFPKLIHSFPEYFGQNTLVVLDEPVRLKEAAGAYAREYFDSYERRLEKGQTVSPERMFEPAELFAVFAKREVLAMSLLGGRIQEIRAAAEYQLPVKNISPYNDQFPMLVKDLISRKKNGWRSVIVSSSKTRCQRLADDLMNEDLSVSYMESTDRGILPGEIAIVRGSLSKGFEYTLEKFAVISENDIFGTQKRHTKHKKAYNGQSISGFAELSVGDYVVHEMHGLGIYRGIEQIEQGGVLKDYVKIEYAKGSSLYIQATQLESLQKYGSGTEHANLKLQVLGGKEWEKTKTRVRGAVKDMAEDLVKLYAARQNGEGYAFGPDTVWQRELEELFPFEETPDQLRAIEETKADMQSTRIMDRLICGDVGYGKTEVALRAAFKAAQDSKQTAILVPTTILAQQHYMTFTQRMKDFPVRIELLSRFRTPAQIKESVKAIKSGSADIIIGTHRLLGKDIQFKNLGLLIIDEEQRFGVSHKEKIKQLKEKVDVLALSATPIPRTLHMSLIGIRDMSVLEEPPLDRVPIQTYISEYDEEMVRAAITRELARDGQVYYVFNRVAGIAEMTGRLRRLVPEARIEFAHGQMKEHELEDIMYRFINGEIDVLVSTTIIETGMDISNVNTMVIHDADGMGLSQLYQLRGRIGRTNRTAYAFLMYRKDKILKETAEKRLAAIRDFTELGSGIKIAMRDLEIRGAGNILGAEQSGHMEAVGYDLYCKMLSEEVARAKGEDVSGDYETVIDIPVDAFIPSSYIKDEKQKIEVYKKIADLTTYDEMDDCEDELTDRFGDIPRSVRNLLGVSVLKSDARKVDLTEIKQEGDRIVLRFYENAGIDITGIPKLLEKYPGRLKFIPSGTPRFTYRPGLVTDRRKGLLYELKLLVDDFVGCLLP